MAQFADLEVLKDIPGYQAILKAVLKSQIQLLVEQLSSQTGEESVILTASINDGTLCHLGSDSGKVFLEDHEDFKSQFLGFCLKRHHKRKTPDTSQSKIQIAQGMSEEISSSKRQRKSSSYAPSPVTPPVHPVTLTKVTPARNVAGQRRPLAHSDTPTPSISSQHPPTDDMFIPETSSSCSVVKLESEEESQQYIPGTSEQEMTLQQSEEQGQGGDSDIVKSEPVEDDLEITGVEMVSDPSSQMAYDKGQWGDDSSGVEGLTFGQSTSAAEGFSGSEMSGYSNRLQLSESGRILTGKQHLELGPEFLQFTMKRSNDCSECGKRFYSRADLKRHMTKHTGERTFKCEICGVLFTLKGNMVAHMRKKHGVNSFVQPSKGK